MNKMQYNEDFFLFTQPFIVVIICMDEIAIKIVLLTSKHYHYVTQHVARRGTCHARL